MGVLEVFLVVEDSQGLNKQVNMEEKSEDMVVSIMMVLMSEIMVRFTGWRAFVQHKGLD
jgi:hypothetical protein